MRIDVITLFPEMIQSFIEQGVTRHAGGKAAAVIRVHLDQVAADGVDDALGHLTAGGSVEEYGRLPAEVAVKRRELLTTPVDGKASGSHGELVRDGSVQIRGQLTRVS